MPEEYEYPDSMPLPPPGMPGGRSDEVFSAVMQEKRVENILEQLNPEHLIVEIEHRLKGYRKNQFSKKWELIGKREKNVSDELISDILSILSGILAINTSISNYTPDEINKIMRTLIRNLIDMIREKAHIYDLLNNYAERDRVMFIACSTVFSTMKRAQGGLESKRLFSSTQIKDTPFQQPQKSAFGRLFNV